MPATPDRAILVTREGADALDLIGRALPEFRFECVDRDDPAATDTPFDPARHAALVVLGDSTRDAFRDRPERRRVAAAMAARAPVLGVCYGAQVLACHQNGAVGLTRGGVFGLRRWHWGVEAVSLTPAGERDPVVGGLAGFGRVPMAHRFGFGVPAGATPLAWSGDDFPRPHCEAFRVGAPADGVYGFQFHPEPTARTLRDAPHWFVAGSGRAYTAEVLEEVERVMAGLLDAWAVLVRARAAG